MYRVVKHSHSGQTMPLPKFLPHWRTVPCITPIESVRVGRMIAAYSPLTSQVVNPTVPNSLLSVVTSAAAVAV